VVKGGWERIDTFKNGSGHLDRGGSPSSALATYAEDGGRGGLSPGCLS